jgi:hypothetical protein
MLLLMRDEKVICSSLNSVVGRFKVEKELTKLKTQPLKSRHFSERLHYATE